MISPLATIANTSGRVVDLDAYRAARLAGRPDPDPTPAGPAAVLAFPALLAVAA